ncbi:hypothetical protein B296_00021957 [Ensete ventricosum]|uniref:Uncharacterized protein n=1 Tax=Ensete ventricosum TaxID=4639 RepID=A0A426XU33_ENSVE|nr:hypothetical protein B296_00021957 [Ensete ventricosum]
MTGTDAKVRQALEAMKLHHDFDSTVCLESLGSIRKHLVFRVSMSFMLRGRGNGRTTLIPGGSTALLDHVHDVGRVITSLDGKVTLLRQELQDLKEGGNPDAVAAVEVRATEAQSLAEHLRVELDEANDRRASVEADLEVARAESASLERQLLLDLARSKEALREDLPKKAVEEYKESPGFEMGLVRMGRVSLEYGHQLALARLQARHPWVEIELDPFVSLPEDVDVPMADE